ncbi:MAG: hypothetical protein WC046_05125 [Candidatus Bathyarchaeia archaeon]
MSIPSTLIDGCLSYEPVEINEPISLIIVDDGIAKPKPSELLIPAVVMTTTYPA